MLIHDILLEYDHAKTLARLTNGITQALSKNSTLSLQDPNKAHGPTNPFIDIDTGEMINAESILTNIESLDPTNNKEFVQGLATLFAKGGLSYDNLRSPEIPQLLTKFATLKKKNIVPADHRDFLKYPTINSFAQYVNQLPNPEDIDKQKSAQQGQAKKVYDDEQMTIITPLDQAAATKYGKGTTWCTTTPPSDGSTNGGMFDQYNNEGPLYILIPKHPEYAGEKYQFHFPSRSFMDETDNPVNPTNLRFFDTLESVFPNEDWDGMFYEDDYEPETYEYSDDDDLSSDQLLNDILQVNADINDVNYSDPGVPRNSKLLNDLGKEKTPEVEKAREVVQDRLFKIGKYDSSRQLLIVPLIDDDIGGPSDYVINALRFLYGWEIPLGRASREGNWGRPDYADWDEVPLLQRGYESPQTAYAIVDLKGIPEKSKTTGEVSKDRSTVKPGVILSADVDPDLGDYQVTELREPTRVPSPDAGSAYRNRETDFSALRADLDPYYKDIKKSLTKLVNDAKKAKSASDSDDDSASDKYWDKFGSVSDVLELKYGRTHSGDSPLSVPLHISDDDVAKVTSQFRGMFEFFRYLASNPNLVKTINDMIPNQRDTINWGDLAQALKNKTPEDQLIAMVNKHVNRGKEDKKSSVSHVNDVFTKLITEPGPFKKGYYNVLTGPQQKKVNKDKVVADYDSGMSPEDLAKKYTKYTGQLTEEVARIIELANYNKV